MKKLCSFLLFIFLLILWFAVPARGESTLPDSNFTSSNSVVSQTHATEKRYLLEFEELAVKRLLEMERICEEGEQIEYDIRFEPFAICREYLEFYSINTTFGLVNISKTDFSVISIIITLSTESEDNVESGINLMKCNAAMSALEYDESYNDDLKSKYKLGLSAYSDVIDEVEKVFAHLLASKLKQYMRESLNSNGDQVLIYSGNYDYYISAMQTDRGTQVFCIAQAR